MQRCPRVDKLLATECTKRAAALCCGPSARRTCDAEDRYRSKEVDACAAALANAPACEAAVTTLPACRGLLHEHIAKRWTEHDTLPGGFTLERPILLGESTADMYATKWGRLVVSGHEFTLPARGTFGHYVIDPDSVLSAMVHPQADIEEHCTKAARAHGAIEGDLKHTELPNGYMVSVVAVSPDKAQSARAEHRCFTNRKRLLHAYAVGPDTRFARRTADRFLGSIKVLRR